MRLHDIAIARSGDKGNRATLSVIARDPALPCSALAHLVIATDIELEEDDDE